MTRQVNIAEAKAKLSELVEAASRGEEILLARHGKPMARLSSIPPSPTPARRMGTLKDRLSPAQISRLTRAIDRPLSAADRAAIAGEQSDMLGLSKPRPGRRRK